MFYFLFFICESEACFICLDLAENETVTDLVSEDNVGNGKSVLKLIDEVENVEKPIKGMAFSSINELNIYYRSYAKKEGFGVVQKKIKKDEKGCAHYLSLGCARQGSRKSSSSNSFCKPSQTIRTGVRPVLMRS
jgi:hypothetical protein